MNEQKKTILITGASSGLGYELAMQYAAPNIRLLLIGRNFNTLNNITDLANTKGAEAHAILLDVRDKTQMKDRLTALYKQYGIDIVIACAGVSSGTLEGPENSSQVEIIFDTNINGVLNTILPLLSYMIGRGSGNIVIISSMAGLIGLSSSPSYSATKACIRIFGEALRSYLKQYNIHTTIVIPGYIKTSMTSANNFPMPFMISASKAAKKIIKGINRNKGIIAFPAVMYITLKILTFLPYRFINYLNSKLPGKPSFEDIFPLE